MSSRNTMHKDLAKLNKLRAQNRTQASLRAYFDHQRKHSDTPDAETQQAWFRGMKNVLQEVDEALRCIPMTSLLNFLDVGCCPGGFSSYILSKNSRATGVGISLPVSSGGHSFLLEDNLRARLDLNMADLTYYQLGLTTVSDPQLQPLPFSPGTRPFDLVLLDGHPLRTSTPSGKYSVQMASRLLISQLIICLEAIAMSGTVVIKLAKPERDVTAKLMYMLDMLALNLTTWKPVYMHATRDTFYAVAKGIGYGKQGHRLQEWLEGLKVLWMDLTYGEMHSAGRPVDATDLDFIVSTFELKRVFAPRLEQLSRHIWQAQASSMAGWKQVEGL